eukprot:364460-Chlamydomonas_euryale.AAC.2
MRRSGSEKGGRGSRRPPAGAICGPGRGPREKKGEKKGRKKGDNVGLRERERKPYTFRDSFREWETS